jgi:hypothetical protein
MEGIEIENYIADKSQHMTKSEARKTAIKILKDQPGFDIFIPLYEKFENSTAIEKKRLKCLI